LNVKIAYASDIHTEFGNQRKLDLPESVDVLVLAGDIGKGVASVDFAASYLGQAKSVVLVAGNHEYWKGELNSVADKMRAAALRDPNIHFLEKQSVEIDGWTFIGASTWTDFSYGGVNQPHNMWSARQVMNDYKQIKFKTRTGTYRKLLPEDVLSVNLQSKQFIFSELEKAKGRSIVVTHHAPTHLSIGPNHTDDGTNHCYVNTWGNDIAYSDGPAIWFHGHIHDPCDYMIGDTRVLCNPIGYPGQYADSTFKFVEV
jgi:predicted phosphodiesterase